jgi:hypothetical protein
MDVTKYTFNFRYAGRLVSVIIEANSIEEAEFVLSGIKEINASYLKLKENG